MLTMPIITLFYQENGLSMSDVLLLQGLYSIAIVALEIPSGYFADLWGRKATMIIGSILGVIGFGIYSFSFSFWGFLAAELTLGIGQSFISGSDSALLYDSLIKLGEEKRYIKLEGRVLSIGNFAETIAALIGGWLAEYSLRTPFIAQTFVAAIAIPASITLLEPFAINKHENRWKTILQVLKNTLKENKSLQWLILLTAIIGTGTLTMAWLIQPYLREILKFSVSEIGTVLAILNLIVGLTTLIAYKVEHRLGLKNSIWIIIIGVSLPYIAMGLHQTTYILFAIVIFYIMRGLATPILKDSINKQSPTEVRATILSIRNFAIRIIFAVFGPFLGWFSDLYSLSDALILAGVGLLIASVFPLIFIRFKS